MISAIVTPAPELHVTVNVTDWPAYQQTRLLEAIEAVRSAVTAATSGAVETKGWTRSALDTAMRRLGSRAEAQARAIQAAADHGGEVSRADVFVLGGYADTRSLKGFTRPTNRVTQALRDAGELPTEADELLETIYDPSIKGYQRAKAFRVPPEVVKLLAAN